MGDTQRRAVALWLGIALVLGGVGLGISATLNGQDGSGGADGTKSVGVPTLALPTPDSSGRASSSLPPTHVLDVQVLPAGAAHPSAAGAIAPPPPPPGVTTSSSCTSTSNRCTVDDHAITADGLGAGALTVAHYPADPVGVPTGFSAAGTWFDVRLATVSNFTTVTLHDCQVGIGSALYWWDQVGGGLWREVVGDPGPTFTAGPPACVTVTLRPVGTSPTLDQLTGTVFVAGSSHGGVFGTTTPGSDTPPTTEARPPEHPPTTTTTEPTTSTTESSTTTTSTTQPTTTTTAAPVSRPPEPALALTPSGSLSWSLTNGLMPGDSTRATLAVQVTGTAAPSVSLSDLVTAGSTPNLAQALTLTVYEDSDPGPVVSDVSLASLGVVPLPGARHADAWAPGETHTFTLVIAFPDTGAADDAYQGASTAFDLIWSRS